MKKYKASIALSLLFIAIWQVSAEVLNMPYILPSPLGILKFLFEFRIPLLTVHLPATLFVTISGLFFSVLGAFLLAVFMDISEKIEAAIYPIITASQTIPITALAPLFTLWFGYSAISRVLVTVIMTFFPIVVSLYDGFKAAKREQEELLITFGADKRDIFFKLKLPYALPNFISALKMAAPLSVIGAAIAEWLGAQAGLGYFSRRMMTQLNGAGVFAPVVLLSLIAVFMVLIINYFEKKILFWRKEI